MEIKKIRICISLVIGIAASMMLACEDEKVYPETRLFRPVLSEDLSAVGNSITVHLARFTRATSYTIELSRDTFKTVDYTIATDTNYVEINDALLQGDPLLWNTLYQVRAIAHAEDPQLDSKISELGSVRTERFPTILNLPAAYDVIDVAARVTWETSGAPVTKVVIFAGADVKLQNPLETFDVIEAEQVDGEKFIEGLNPATKYQVAIYSGDDLRGWVDYTTLVEDIDPTAPGVHDLRAATDPTAVATEVAAAASGDVILISRGSKFDLPTVALDKSITIRAAYGFGPKKAILYNTNGNWNFAAGSTIDHVRFIDLELRGGNFGGTYVFNPNAANISVNELLFENCNINTMRGVIRLRNDNVVINNYKFINCKLDSIGSYGLVTCDQAANGPPSTTARVNNIVLENSTFNRFQLFISTYNNMQSILIESCTFNNILVTESTNFLFRFRGGAGNNDVTNGISIRNSIFGPGWNTAGTATNNIRGKEGLPNTPIDIVNTYATNDWTFIATFEIAGFPSAIYPGGQSSLWVSSSTYNFNFKDSGFSGKYNAGDPRWRVKL